MPKIPESDLTRIKQETPIQFLIESSGIILKKKGENLTGLCPFHNDKGPSLIVTPSKNLWNCLGACGVGGGPIDWVMKIENTDFRKAADLLLKGYPHLQKKAEPPLFTPEENPDSILTRTVDFYHIKFLKNWEGREYLKERGIENQEAVNLFQIGLADRSLGTSLPSRDTKEGKEIREQLKKAGIFRDSGHEHFAGSVIFPITKDKKITEIYGRKYGSCLRSGSQSHSYLPGPHAGVWNGEHLKEGEIILCESIIDALTFYVHGFKNVTASYGVNGFTQEFIDLFKAKGVERVYIAYDRDQAGEKASLKLAEKLVLDEFGVYRILFPRNMDPNSFALQMLPTSRQKSLGLLIKTAEWLGGKPAPITLGVPQSPKEETTTEKPIPESDEGTNPHFESNKSGGRGVGARSSAQQSEHCPGSPRTGPLINVPQNEDSTNPIFSKSDREAIFTLSDRTYRIRGLEKNTGFDMMKLNLKISKGESFHLDTLDLYQSRARQSFILQAAKETGLDIELIKEDLGKLLHKLEQCQEEILKKDQPSEQAVILTPAEKSEALELLKDPNLLERILKDFESAGLVGEETNKLVGYLAATSRKLEEPLAILIQSSSAAGKSSLMEGILKFIPPEEQVKYSAMTGQSLYYMGGKNLKHKILAVAEEEGMASASYPMKLLQSEGELTIASTGKDPSTGKLQTQEYHVEGPVQLFLTTTGIEIDEELLNRCLVLSVDEDREQTRAIHQKQREGQTLEGLLNKKSREDKSRLHQNAQRLLVSLLVANPLAEKLTFLDDKTRTRRDHLKYLTLIRTIAFLHQYQREIKSIIHQGQPIQYIEVTKKDIEIADSLAHEFLGRTLDELPPQTRKFLFKIEEYVQEEAAKKESHINEILFTRRTIREHTGASLTQSHTHLQRLLAMEYLQLHRTPNGQGFLFELLYRGEGKTGEKFILGLNLKEDKMGGRVVGAKKELESKPHLVASRSEFFPSHSEQKAEDSDPIRGRFAPNSGVFRSLPTPLHPTSHLISFPNLPVFLQKPHKGNGSAKTI